MITILFILSTMIMNIHLLHYSQVTQTLKLTKFYSLNISQGYNRVVPKQNTTKQNKKKYATYHFIRNLNNLPNTYNPCNIYWCNLETVHPYLHFSFKLCNISVSHVFLVYIQFGWWCFDEDTQIQPIHNDIIHHLFFVIQIWLYSICASDVLQNHL